MNSSCYNVIIDKLPFIQTFIEAILMTGNRVDKGLGRRYQSKNNFEVWHDNNHQPFSSHGIQQGDQNEWLWKQIIATDKKNNMELWRYDYHTPLNGCTTTLARKRKISATLARPLTQHFGQNVWLRLATRYLRQRRFRGRVNCSKGWSNNATGWFCIRLGPVQATKHDLNLWWTQDFWHLYASLGSDEISQE